MKVGLFCGAKWWRKADWKTYGVFRLHRDIRGFNVGPILIWDGS